MSVKKLFAVGCISYVKSFSGHFTYRPQFSRALILLGTIVGISMPVTVSAITTLSQGFVSATTLPLGSIVSIENNSADHVDATTVDTVNNMLGVVINVSNSLLSLSDGQANQVQVATNGVVEVLASNINGPISQGDQITASPISGVGMKVTGNIKVVGISQGSLSTNNSTQEDYTDKAGKKHTVMIGEVPVVVNVSYFYKQPDKSIIPSTVQSVANALAGKSVNSLPIVISMAIFIVTLIVVVSIIYTMIRSSIISVGRNPMSQSAIYRDIIQLSALVLVILAVALLAIYFILKGF